MNGRYENGALPEKVRLLYEAVLAMVTDGWDINRMKVSDITAQAGIGKGTAYEYFSSKEEIIANAVLYDVEMRLAHVLEITKGEGDFAGKFVQILTYMEEVFAKRLAFCLLVRQVIYCKDRMTDAVLCAWKSNLEKKKIELHYEIEGYDRGEIEEQDLAKILIGILNWGENLAKREEHREIRMKITGVKNQLILECLTSSGRQNPMSRKLFRGLVKKYNGKIQEKKEKTGKFGLTVILSRYVSL